MCKGVDASPIVLSEEAKSTYKSQRNTSSFVEGGKLELTQRRYFLAIFGKNGEDTASLIFQERFNNFKR